MLSGGHSCNPARRPVRTRIGSAAGAGVIVAVGGHGERQHFEVGTDLFCQIDAEVGGVSVRLPFHVGKLMRPKVGPDFGVLEGNNNKKELSSCRAFGSGMFLLSSRKIMVFIVLEKGKNGL